MTELGTWGVFALLITSLTACEQGGRGPADRAQLPAQAKTEAHEAATVAPANPIEPAPEVATKPAAQPVPAPPSEALPVFAMARLTHAAPVTDVAWAADGGVIATASSDGKLRLWDPNSFALTRTIEGQPGADRHVSISRDGATVVANAELEVHVFDGGTGNLRHTLTHQGPTRAVAVSADASVIASGGADGLRIWNADGSERAHIQQRRDAAISLLFSADGRTLASGWGDRRVRLIDAASGEVTRTIQTKSTPQTLAYSSDGERVAAPTGANQFGVFTAATGKRIAQVPLALPLAFGIEGRLLLGAGETADGQFAISLIDGGSLGIVRGFLGHTDEVTDAVFSPDASAFATASLDHTVLIWTAP